MHILQEAGKVVWHSNLLQTFPHFVVVHTIKGFGVVNKAEIHLEFSCYSFDPVDAGNLTSIPLPLLNPA